MTSRSGSSLVCGILAAHGLAWQDGNSDPRQHYRGPGSYGYRTFEHPSIKAMLKTTIHPEKKCQKWPKGDMVPVTNPKLDIMKRGMQNAYWLPLDFVKSGVEFADLWKAWGELASIDINFIKVYRPPEDIAASLERRGIGPYDVGYEVACKRLELMDTVPGVTVATNMLMAEEDWHVSDIKRAVESCGVKWDRAATKLVIDPEKFHD